MKHEKSRRTPKKKGPKRKIKRSIFRKIYYIVEEEKGGGTLKKKSLHAFIYQSHNLYWEFDFAYAV